MKIYIAGSSKQVNHIAMLIAEVQSYGYELTYDWTKDILASLARPFGEEELTAAARADLDAVQRADVLWYVVPSEGKSEGAAAELGAALALGRTVIVSGDLNRDRIFPRLATHRFQRHDEALKWLRECAEARRVWLARARCHADDDGDCKWSECPQNKPETRKPWCPLAVKHEDS